MTTSLPVDLRLTLENYRAEINNDLIISENLDKKCILLEDANRKLKLKIKLYNLDDEECKK
jgi:hypothetical protein